MIEVSPMPEVHTVIEEAQLILTHELIDGIHNGNDELQCRHGDILHEDWWVTDLRNKEIRDGSSNDDGRLMGIMWCGIERKYGDRIET